MDKLGSKTGPKIKIPNKKGSDFSHVLHRFNENKLVLTEKDKTENDFRLLKQNVLIYEQKGRRTIAANRNKIIKNQQRANGTLDLKDYLKDTSLKEELSLVDNVEDELEEIEFFPLTSKIVNVLTSFLSKTKVGYSVLAVNREAQNDILDRKNGDIRNLLVSSAMQFFNQDLEAQGITPESQPDVYEEQIKIFQQLPKIQKYYNTEFRLTIEQWANHVMENAKRKFNMPDIEKQLFRNRIINDRPFLHLNLKEDEVRPEVIRPENAAYLKSPHNDDVSHSYMFMWYEYEAPETIIQRFGDKLNEETIQKLHLRFGSTNFTATTAANFEFETKKPVEADIQNYLAFRTEEDTTHRHRGEEYRERLVEILNMYVQIPRIMKKVTFRVGEEEVTKIVDETYLPVFKPTYLKGKPKTAEYLLEGEHVEVFYINELHRVQKLNFSRNANPDLSDDVWLSIEKYKVQLSDPKIGRFGSYIPVHGGATTNKYSESSQIVDKTEVWEIAFNFVWNRIMQILKTEIGPFFVMNQNAIPSESMDGSWGKNNLVKFAMTARDLGIGAVDTSPSNMQGGSQLTGGFGQKVDLSRMDEIAQKVQLAMSIKEECYSVLGITSQFLSEISPQETEAGIAQGVQRTVNAVKEVYDDHYSMMEKGWQTFLEITKYLKIKEGSTADSYLNSEGERQIFQTTTEDFPLYMLGVYTSSSFDDALLIAEMKEMVRRDNTMGADLEDKIKMLSTHSLSDIYSALKDLTVKKQAEVQKQQENEQRQLQAKIEADERIKASELAWEKEKLLLKIESDEYIQEMRVVGQSSFGQGTGVEELLNLKKADLAEKDYYMSVLNQAKEAESQRGAMREKLKADRLTNDTNESLRREELQVKREEIAAKLKISKDNLKVAVVNK
jgi:hypothetical protein